MSASYARSLCARVPRRGSGGQGGLPLRIAIGLEPSRPLAQQWEELRKLKADLQADGFRSAEVKAVLVRGNPLPHEAFRFHQNHSTVVVYRLSKPVRHQPP